MYVKKLVLDGFKSYGRRTEIDGFDPEFTAIPRPMLTTTIYGLNI
ncbi:structural maintenance of chromosomes protein 2-like [Drosophila madeirensis]|uniref:Structural maintenance of chromosomes protein 2-like n=1 Tax=Drosophila madeirensis TaxID=30013 RepID=A0AAU9G6T0_DROMD